VRAWKQEPDQIGRVSGQVASHLQAALSGPPTSDITLTLNDLDAVVMSLIDSYDWNYGSWGTAPKFPQPMIIEFFAAPLCRG